MRTAAATAVLTGPQPVDGDGLLRSALTAETVLISHLISALYAVGHPFQDTIRW